jgi:phage virion morphogenesis protein
MKMIGVEIANDNIEFLKELSKKLNQKSPLLEEIGRVFVNLTSESFQKEASPAGIKWTPNAESTLLQLLKRGRKRGEKGKKKILHESGELVRSIEPTIVGDTVIIGTNKEYAAIHQFGGKAGRGRKVTIEARPYLPVTANGELTKEGEDLIYKAIEDFLTEDD